MEKYYGEAACLLICRGHSKAEVRKYSGSTMEVLLEFENALRNQ